MARFYRFLAAFMALMIITCCLPAFEDRALAESDGMVRVKITRLGTVKSITFKTSCDYFVDGDKSLRIPSGSSVTVKVSGSNLLLICGTYSLNMGSDFTIKRQYTGVTGVKFTAPSLSNVYCGDFRFMLESGNITTIMTIFVEDYLYGVVGCEMSNSYPLEALKAQAIAARNYVLRAKSGRANKAYDVVDNANDQVYKGYNSSYTKVIRAVDETRGIVLGYNGKLAACYYTASNGGQTESTKNAWGSTLAYSVVKEDKYDLEGMGKHNYVTIKKDQSNVTTNAQLKAALVDGMKDKLEANGLSTDIDDVHIETIVAIEPINPKYASPSILYKTLRFTVVASSVDANGERVSGTVTVDIPTYGGIEDWFGLSINSSSNETVIVEESDSAFTISFRRWGHGIGMSQHGARIMALNYSMDYEDILAFYYPGTEIAKLNLADTTGSGLSDNGGASVLGKPLEPESTPEAGEEEKPVMQAVVQLDSASSSLNMRSASSTSSDVVTRLKHGTVIDVYSVTGDWASVGYNGYRGYVMTKYLVKAGGEEQQPEATPTPTPESGSAPIMQAKVKLSSTSGTLNMRSSATTSSTVVARLKHGAQVDVYAIEGDWVAIGVNGTRGYVMKKYLVKIDNGAAQPEATPTPKPEEGNGAIMQARVKLSGSSSKLNVRKSASTSAKVVTTVKHGTQVDVYAIKGDWVEIGVNGYRGYVMKKYLVSAEPAATAQPTPVPTAAPTPEPTAQPTAEPTAEPTAQPTTEPTQNTGTAASITAKVKLSSGSKLTVRKGPGTSYAAKGYLKNGQIVEVTAVSGSWAKITTTSGMTGYVHKNYLVRVDGGNSAANATTAPQETSIKAVAVESTFVYSATDTSSPAIAGLDKGDTVTVTAYNSTWAKVLIDGNTGYVPTEHLKRAK